MEGCTWTESSIPVGTFWKRRDIPWKMFKEARKRSQCIIFTILLPFLLVIIPETLVIGILFPLGFLTLFMEKFSPLGFLTISSFLSLGDIANLFGDISLLLNVMWIIIAGESGSQTDSLFIARICLTVFGGIFGALLVLGFIVNSKIKGGETCIETGMSCLVLGVLSLMIIWKFFLIALKIYMIFMSIVLFLKPRKDEVSHCLTWWELLIFIDLCLSGIPLGVLTILETTVYENTGLSGLLVVIKLCGLAIGIGSANYLIYFEIIDCFHLRTEKNGGKDANLINETAKPLAAV